MIVTDWLACGQEWRDSTWPTPFPEVLREHDVCQGFRQTNVMLWPHTAAQSSSKIQTSLLRYPIHGRNHQIGGCVNCGVPMRAQIRYYTGKASRSVKENANGHFHKLANGKKSADLDVDTIRQDFSFRPAFRSRRKYGSRSKHDGEHLIRVLIMPSSNQHRGDGKIPDALESNIIFAAELSKTSHLVLVTNSPPFRSKWFRDIHPS